MGGTARARVYHADTAAIFLKEGKGKNEMVCNG